MPFSIPKTERIDADLSKVVDRVRRQYESFPKAFQKEAIQNAWDARVDRKEAKGWKINFYSYKEKGMEHFIIEDFGTTGMDEKKWRAFLSLWKPEKTRLDAGGQGQGKFVLMDASEDEILIVESNSDELGYACRFLQKDQRSLETEKFTIKRFVSSASPLAHKGTKIWIYNAKKEFLKDIHSQEFIDFILETWWQILESRLKAGVFLFDKKITVPTLPPVKEEVTLLENRLLKNFGRIKRLVLRFYEKPIPVIFQGIRVQRANMMVTKIPFEIYDKDYKDRFSGYIEFDRDLESRLKDIEKTDHCGFLYESPWKEIKSLLKEEAEKFVNKILPKKQERKTIQLKNLNKIIQKANQIIGELCPEVIGRGPTVPIIPKKPKSPIRIKYLNINKREVKYGDVIRPSVSIVNETKENKKILLRVELKKDGTRISKEEYKLKIMSNQQKTMRLSEIKLEEKNFQKGKYTIRVTLEENRHELDTKATSFYLEVKREPVKRGFIKHVEFFDSESPVRNTPINKGIIRINLLHKDFINIWESFRSKPRQQNEQIGFYIIKICLDEAINELLQIKLKDLQNSDPEETIREIINLRDKMYYEVYI